MLGGARTGARRTPRTPQLGLPRFGGHLGLDRLSMLWLPLGFKRPRAEVAERRVPPLAVVEDFDVVEQRSFGGSTREPARLVDELDLQRRKEALGDGVVPAIAGSAQTHDDPMVRQQAAVLIADVLRPAVGVVHEADCGAPAGEAHGQRLERQALA